MKAAIASVTAMFVLAGGVSLVGMQPLAPDWFCKMFPIMCPPRT
ncbi:hypothetical protein [Propioniciclava coleopterorum]|nr:hypothetical protein [Propioniciclava coleopterorum]